MMGLAQYYLTLKYIQIVISITRTETQDFVCEILLVEFNPAVI